MQRPGLSTPDTRRGAREDLRRRKSCRKRQNRSAPTLRETPIKACRWHYLRTGVLLSSAGLARTMSIATARLLSALPGRHGYSFAAVVCGHSRAVNWLARPTHLEGGCFPKVPPWRSPLMATPLLSADLATIGPPVPPGCSSAAAVLGSSKATSWSAPALIACVTQAY